MQKSYFFYIWFFTFFFFVALPYATFAQTPDPRGINTILTQFIAFLTVLIQILIVCAVLVFGWGVVRFMITANSGDAKKITETKQILLWGIIGIAVLASLYGILFFIQSYIGIPNNSPIEIPEFNPKPFS